MRIVMAQPKDIRGPRDIGYIDLPSEADRDYWAREFGCSQQQLADAVASVGPLVVDVRSHLGKRREESAEAAERPEARAHA